MFDQAEKASGDFGAFPTRRFTTEGLRVRDRLPMWREEFGRSLLSVEIEPLTTGAIFAEATMRSLPGVRTLLFKGSAMRFNRTRALAAGGDDSIGLIVNLDTENSLSQRSSQLRLAYGDACSLLTEEPGIVAGRGHLGLLFPRAALLSRARNIADVAASRIPRETESLRLLLAYLSALPDKLKLDQGELQRIVIDHIYDLAALTICPNRSADDSTMQATAEARLQLALNYIGRHFDAPDLTIAAVASDQHISPRYLQRLIETTGSTFSERVQELRLQRAYALLADAQHKQARISDIALRAGFSDISHFNRSFRRRFGDTPRNIRAGIGPT